MKAHRNSVKRIMGTLKVLLFSTSLSFPSSERAFSETCSDVQENVLKRFHDPRENLFGVGDHSRQLAKIRNQKCNSMEASFLLVKNSCLESWEKLYRSIEDHAQRLKLACEKFSQAIKQCTKSEKAQECFLQEEAVFNLELEDARRRLSKSVEEARAHRLMVPSYQRALGPTPPSSRNCSAPSGCAQLPTAAGEREDFARANDVFIRIAEREQSEITSLRNFVSGSSRSQIETLNRMQTPESDLTGLDSEKEKHSDSANASIKAAAAAMDVTRSGVALSKVLGGGDSTAKVAEVSGPPSSRASSGSSYPRSGLPKREPASLSQEPAGDKSGKRPTGQASVGDREPGSSDAGSGAKFRLSQFGIQQGGNSGIAERNSFSGLSEKSGESAIGASNGAFPSMSSEHSSDSGAKGNNGSSAKDESGYFGSRLGVSKPFINEGSSPNPKDFAMASAMDGFPASPLNDQEKELLRLLDDGDDSKLGSSPVEARERLSKQLGTSMVDTGAKIFASEEEREEAQRNFEKGGNGERIQAAVGFSLFVRVKLAHRRATRRGLIIRKPPPLPVGMPGFTHKPLEKTS